MTTQCDHVLKDLFDAFSGVEKPVPLTPKTGSHDDAEVDVFNATDWDTATYSDALAATEGLIICPALTRVWLLPRLFRIVLLRLHGATDGAADNLSSYLETWPIDPDVTPHLSDGQKAAIVRAWDHLDATIYAPSGSHVGRALAAHWGCAT